VKRGEREADDFKMGKKSENMRRKIKRKRKIGRMSRKSQKSVNIGRRKIR
jgi:hypothetical protein